jgi:hypothetical protein
MHGDSVVIEVREAVLPGNIRREQLSPGLGRLFRRNLEEARKHLFELSQKIAHGLERRGMKLFKRRAGKMFVSRVKPKAVDPGVIFSERINSIVEAVRREPGILASKLVEKIAPSPAPAPQAEGEAAAAPKAQQFTDEQVAVLRDLRWLSDEGYVIEYSDGPVFLGVQGEPPQHAPEAKGEGKAKDKGKEPAAPAAPAHAEAAAAPVEAEAAVVEAPEALAEVPAPVAAPAAEEEAPAAPVVDAVAETAPAVEEEAPPAPVEPVAAAPLAPEVPAEKVEAESEAPTIHLQS